MWFDLKKSIYRICSLLDELRPAASGRSYRGQIAYVDSPRHANYVDVEIYRRTLSEIRERFGWVDSDHRTYDPVSMGSEGSRLHSDIEPS